MTALTHIAGTRVRVGSRVRQRCGWCGAVLVDEDLGRAAFEEDAGRIAPGWNPSDLVTVNGCGMFAVPLGVLPSDACARIDDSVTT